MSVRAVFAMFTMFAVCSVSLTVPGPSAADQVCKPVCTRAATCPIAGPQCLHFDWCRNECGDGQPTPTRADTDRELPTVGERPEGESEPGPQAQPLPFPGN